MGEKMSLYSRRDYQHLNLIKIKRQALIDNYQALSEFAAPAQIAPVLKSNAYGHGLNLTAAVYDQLQPPLMIVDSLYEAYELYKLKISTPILIIGYTDPRNYQIKALPFHFTVFDLETARVLNQAQPGCKIHFFVDTGMNREGVPLADWSTFLDKILKLKNIKIAGLASHLADADNPDSAEFSKKQLKNYQQALKIMRAKGIEPRYRHLAASAGSFQLKELKELQSFNLIRVGLAGYGLNPLEQPLPLKLKPALNFQTTITQIKKLKINETVSYNRTFRANKVMTIGILTAGYQDGVDRRLSNRGWVKVADQFCRILGRVCMNLTVIDLSSVKKPQVGQKAEIFSDQAAAKNSIVQQAKTAKTIPYVLLTGLDASTKRELV